MLKRFRRREAPEVPAGEDGVNRALWSHSHSDLLLLCHSEVRRSFLSRAIRQDAQHRDQKTNKADTTLAAERLLEQHINEQGVTTIAVTC